MNEQAKANILARIQAANAALPAPSPIVRNYRQRDERAHTLLVEEFSQRLHDYKARLIPTTLKDLTQTITTLCQEEVITQLIVPADLPESWLPSQVTIRRDEPPLSLPELDRIPAVLTGCALAIAQTGSIVLDGSQAQGRRVLSLIADRHLCIVQEDQIVGLLPEAINKLAQHPERPITFISGPSATSDIEFQRVEGVHGPRTLLVILITKQG